MSPLDGTRGDSSQPDAPAGTGGDFADRLAALERLVLQSQSEIAELRRAMPTATRVMPNDVAAGGRSLFVDPAVADALRRPPRDEAGASATPTFAERIHSGAALSGVELESLVGRYGTLALAALVILMAVGAVIKMAVERGLLTPEVRVAAGLIVAALRWNLNGWAKDFTDEQGVDGAARMAQVLLAIAPRQMPAAGSPAREWARKFVTDPAYQLK